MKRAADHLELLRSTLRVGTLYADLDGTLLGPGGSLFASEEGVTTRPAEAVAALALAGVDLVLVSGRTRAQIREVARLVGACAYVAELGGVLVYRESGSETVIRVDEASRGLGNAQQAIQRSGAAGLLLEAFRGRLEPHAPWAFVERECSVLLRGNVDEDEARKVLQRAGHDWLDIQDNGVIPNRPGRFPGLDVEEVHAYHLVPAGISKRAAVALYRSRRNLPPESCIVVGDSASDAEIAPEVGAVFIVANGAPGLRGRLLAENVYLLDHSYGLGFADVVETFTS